MGTYNTECLGRASGRIVMLINDDVLMRTPAWDEHLRELDHEFKDGIYLGYGNDLFKGRRISTFPILSRRTCDVLVTPFPSQYRGSLIDYHLFDTFKRLQKMGHDRIRYLEHVIFEHLHYRTGKTPFDATYAHRQRFADDGTFAGLRNQRQVSAGRLAAAIDGKVFQSLPEQPAGYEPPKTIRRVLSGYARTFLGDSGLPWAWRLFLFAWYCGRHLAARGYRP
jgi:hypothetical protein